MSIPSRILAATAVGFAGLLFGSLAQAQVSGTIKGRIIDGQGGVLPGVTVTVSGPELQGVRAAGSDDAGHYVLQGLPPGTYELTAELSGFSTFAQPGLALRAGQTLTLDITLPIGKRAEDVMVSGRAVDAPIIDVQSPELKFNVSGEFMNKLPLSSRQQWDQVWFLVPGAVTLGREGPDSNIDPAIHGASVRSNVYKLDGFSIGSSFTNQGWTTQFSTEIIQDVQIKTAGVDASTPLGQGGFINVVTQSGSNALHGSAAVFAQPRGFNDNNVPGGRPADQSLYQPDVSLGGPIQKDRMWFFASYRRVYIAEGVARSAQVLQTFRDNGFEVPSYDRVQRNNRFFAKLTRRVGANHTARLTYLNDRSQTYNSDSRDFTTQEATIDIAEGGPTYQVSWTAALSSRLLLNAQYGYRKIISDVDFKGGDQPAITRFGRTVVSGGNLAGRDTILQYGNRAGFASGSEGVRDHHELTADLSYVKDGWFGQHTFQTGLQWKPRTRIDTDSVYPPGGRVTVDEVRVMRPDGSVAYLPFRRVSLSPTRVPSLVGSTRLFGAFVQDKWAPTDRLSLSLGLRVDRQWSVDGIGTKNFDTTSINPRLGVSYRLSAGGRDAIRASWGRINDLIYVQGLDGTLSGGAATRLTEWDNNLDGVFEMRLETPGAAQRNLSGDFLFDPELHTPYTNELHLGYTRQLPGKVVLDVAYVNRLYKDDLVRFDSNIIYEGGLFRGYRDPGRNAITLLRNQRASKRRYQSFELSVIRNVGGKWHAFASYTYQRMVETGQFAYDDVNGYLAPPDWFRNDKLARPHLLRLNGSVYLPWRFTAAIIYSMQSGAYGGPLVKDLPAPDPAFGPPTLRLPNGRVVPNPLATPRRLTGPRSEGQLRAPAIQRLNLRLGKEVRFGSQTLEFNVDFFNTTNAGEPLFFRADANNTTSPFFGQLSSTTQSPRGAQVSIRYRF